MSNRGGSADPRATPRSPPRRSSVMRCSSHTSTDTPGRPRACSSAKAAKRVGVKELGGSLTRSRARQTASATATPRLVPSARSAPSSPVPATTKRSITPSSGSLLWETNRYAASTAPSVTAWTARRAEPALAASDAGTTSTTAPLFPPARTSAAAARRSTAAPALPAAAAAPRAPAAPGPPAAPVAPVAPAAPPAPARSSLPHPTNTTAGTSAPNEPWALGASTTVMVWPTLPANPR